MLKQGNEFLGAHAVLFKKPAFDCGNQNIRHKIYLKNDAFLMGFIGNLA